MPLLNILAPITGNNNNNVNTASTTGGLISTLSDTLNTVTTTITPVTTVLQPVAPATVLQPITTIVNETILSVPSTVNGITTSIPDPIIPLPVLPTLPAIPTQPGGIINDIIPVVPAIISPTVLVPAVILGSDPTIGGVDGIVQPVIDDANIPQVPDISIPTEVIDPLNTTISSLPIPSESINNPLPLKNPLDILPVPLVVKDNTQNVNNILDNILPLGSTIDPSTVVASVPSIITNVVSDTNPQLTNVVDIIKNPISSVQGLITPTPDVLGSLPDVTNINLNDVEAYIGLVNYLVKAQTGNAIDAQHILDTLTTDPSAAVTELFNKVNLTNLITSIVAILQGILGILSQLPQ